jgi:Cu(I)/Ag(I) efflux system membrane protein CusA/SilA
MLGGMVTAPLLSMFVIPAAYKLMRRREVERGARPRSSPSPSAPVVNA